MSQVNKTTKYINFHNNSDLPIMIDSWIDGSNTLQCLKVGPGEKRVIHSSVGEWHVNSMFDEDDDWTMWKEHGLKSYVNLGKFRSDPCAIGEYSWMDWDHIFDCIYSKCDPILLPMSSQPITGLVTFVFKGLQA